MDIQRQFQFNAVYVVQYLNSADDATGAELYDAVLAPLGTAAGIDVAFRDVHSARQLVAALNGIADECAAHGRAPILHLETHGTPAGIGVDSSDMILWETLKPILTRLNRLSRVNLLVTMAACHGFNIVRTLWPTDRAPAWGLLGPDEQVMPSDVRSGFRAFYEALLTGSSLSDSLDALRAADSSWPATWQFQNAEFFLAAVYNRYLERHGTPAELEEREERLVQRARSHLRLSGLDVAAARVFIRIQLHKEEQFFGKTKRHFLMLDEFPENEDRFPITLPEAKAVFASVDNGADPMQ